MKEIKAITPDGVYYTDDEGNLQVIDFESCYQNFLKKMQKELGSRFNDEARKGYDKFKNVGIRYEAGSYSVVFYTVPPISFDFPDVEGVWDIAYRVNKAGWSIPEPE